MVCRVFLCISCSYLFVRFSQFAFFPSSLRSPVWITITCGLGGKQKEEEQQQKRTCFREAFRTTILISTGVALFRVSSKFGLGSEML